MEESLQINTCLESEKSAEGVLKVIFVIDDDKFTELTKPTV